MRSRPAVGWSALAATRRKRRFLAAPATRLASATLPAAGIPARRAESNVRYAVSFSPAQLAAGLALSPSGLPREPSRFPVTGAVGTTGTVKCNIGSLPSGGTAQLTIAVLVVAPKATKITDTVKVTSSTTDPDLMDNQATVSTAVK